MGTWIKWWEKHPLNEPPGFYLDFDSRPGLRVARPLQLGYNHETEPERCQSRMPENDDTVRGMTVDVIEYSRRQIRSEEASTESDPTLADCLLVQLTIQHLPQVGFFHSGAVGTSPA